MNPRKLATTWLGGCLALLLAAAPALAQSGTVTGVVTQSGTGQPLEGAVVQLEGTSFSNVTGANGRYLLLNVPAGTYTLVVQTSATRRRVEITVTAGQSTRADVLPSRVDHAPGAGHGRRGGDSEGEAAVHRRARRCERSPSRT